MKSKDNSFFLTIEGCEGTGKSTLVEGIYKHLVEVEQRLVVKSREPGGTPFGKKIREILLNPDSIAIDSRSELFLFLSDRAEHVETVIKPALMQNMIVICDRFTDSSIAYQGAARKISDIERLESICMFATDDLVPDLTLYLDLEPEIGLTRIKRDKDRLENENLEFHKRVREGYLKLAEENPNRIHILDANQDPQIVLSLALEKLLGVMRKFHVAT